MKKMIMNSLGSITELEYDEEMTLRDYFAAKAMQAYVTELTHKEAEYVCGSVAEMAYFMADAMMEARND